MGDNRGFALAKVCEYFYFAEKHKNDQNPPEFEVEPDMAFFMLEAADFLEA